MLIVAVGGMISVAERVMDMHYIVDMCYIVARCYMVASVREEVLCSTVQWGEQRGIDQGVWGEVRSVDDDACRQGNHSTQCGIYLGHQRKATK